MPPISEHRRSAISAEAFGPWNVRCEFRGEPGDDNPPTSAKDRAFLSQALANSLPPLGAYLEDIDEEQFQNIIDAFCRYRVPPDFDVVVQGDVVEENQPGLFVLESGKLEVCVRGRLVQTYGRQGDVFGELAVLYNAPRAATVTSVSTSIIWGVSRETVNEAKLRSAQARRRCYDALLRDVELLSPLGPEDREKVIDALQLRFFREGTEIIRQNDIGRDFFLLRTGEAVALKDGREVMRYLKGSCFGELALLYDQPRAATIIAVRDCECASLDRESFNRLLGPLHSIRRVDYTDRHDVWRKTSASRSSSLASTASSSSSAQPRQNSSFFRHKIVSMRFVN